MTPREVAQEGSGLEKIARVRRRVEPVARAGEEPAGIVGASALVPESGEARRRPELERLRVCRTSQSKRALEADLRHRHGIALPVSSPPAGSVPGVRARAARLRHEELTFQTPELGRVRAVEAGLR